MSYLHAAEAWVRGLEVQLVALNPDFVGIDLVYCGQLAVVCWIGGHVMTRGQLLPAWLRKCIR
jgi:hypothetical protein